VAREGTASRGTCSPGRNAAPEDTWLVRGQVYDVAVSTPNHHSAARLLETLAEPRLIPPTVVAEVCYLLSELVARTPRSGSCATSGRVACGWPS
jgi:hypothetical protein